MLYPMATVPLVLWLLGLVTTTMGGFVPVWLVMAVVVVLRRVIKGRPPLPAGCISGRERS